MAIINIEDFFGFDKQEPVNRISYTEEDAKYKLKYIKVMQDLGMKITIDDAGNICGTLPGKFSKNKNLVMGSHTDSVFNGGQFDGPVGVYMALKAVEEFKKNSKGAQYGNLKVAIYACEESSRFSKACLGSHYISGELSFEDLAKLKDKQGVSFSEAIAIYKEYISSHLADYGIDLNNIEFVDKILTPEEVTKAVEGHIEQSERISNLGRDIGIVDSIGKPVRGNITIQGENSIVTSAKVVKELTELAKASKLEDEENLRITIPRFDSNVNSGDVKTVTSTSDKKLISISVFGKNNHSGATPMDQRQDSVLSLSELILRLQKFKESNPGVEFEFLGATTPKWGANQVQNYANLILRVDSNLIEAEQEMEDSEQDENGVAKSARKIKFLEVLKAFSDDIQAEENVRFEMRNIDEATVSTKPFSSLFVDVRQQGSVKGNESRDRIFELFKKIQHMKGLKSNSISCKILEKGDPVQTAPELLEDLKGICEEKGIPYVKMHSWPGHDLACILPPSNKKGKRILFFIPSQGGSHNPNETTSKEAIEIGTDVYTTFVNKTMRDFQKEYEQGVR